MNNQFSKLRGLRYFRGRENPKINHPDLPWEYEQTF